MWGTLRGKNEWYWVDGCMLSRVGEDQTTHNGAICQDREVRRSVAFSLPQKEVSASLCKTPNCSFCCWLAAECTSLPTSLHFPVPATRKKYLMFLRKSN